MTRSETERLFDGGFVGSSCARYLCCEEALVQVEEDSGVVKDAGIGVEDEEVDAEVGEEGEEEEEGKEEEGVSSCWDDCFCSSGVGQVEDMDGVDGVGEDEAMGWVGERGGEEGDDAKSETGLVSVRSGDSSLALLILLLKMVDNTL